MQRELLVVTGTFEDTPAKAVIGGSYQINKTI